MRAGISALCLCSAWTATGAVILRRVDGDEAEATVNCTGTFTGGEPAADACNPPFSCNDPPSKKGKQAATDDGHADFTFWCNTPQYLDPAIRCAQGNISGYGLDIYPTQVKAGVADIDAQYCMEIGHCGYSDDSPYPNSGEITEHTTLAEMESICDARWTHKTWTTLTSTKALADLALALAFDKKHLKPFGAVAMSQLSCASGNYHCDTMYCRESYCKNPLYAKWLYLRPNKAA